MIKRFVITIPLFIVLLLSGNIVRADSDNIFVGTDTVDEVYEDLDIIMEESSAPYQDGELTPDELNFERTQKIFIDTLPYFFKEKKVTADSLKELINNSDYVYYMPIYREHETVFLTIARGSEITEENYQLFEQVSITDEELARLERDVGRWCVTEIGVDKPRNPSTDYIGLMESYLAYKDIHNAEVYFVSTINPKSPITAVVFTGKMTESGEDEIIFVAVDSLQYNGFGNLISVEPYLYEDDGDYEIEDAEYTYEELRELSKEFDLGPGLSGGGGASQKHSWIPIAAVIAVLCLGIVICTVLAGTNSKKEK